MSNKSIVIIDADSSLYTLRVALEQRYDIIVNHTHDTETGLELVRSSPPNYIVVNPNGIDTEVTVFLAQLAQSDEMTPVIVAGNEQQRYALHEVYAQVVGSIPSSYNEDDLLPFLQPQRMPLPNKGGKRALADRAKLVQSNRLLEQRVQEMMTLYQIGKAVASLTDLDAMLARIVEAAVFLLRAEESSILLLDRGTNALYLRAQKGLGEKQARGFNLKTEDTLIGSVVQTGRPVRLARGNQDDERLKVVTGYLVNALLYVPLALRGNVIGVLGVANATAQRAFDAHDQRLMEALADYATLAIEVAHQYRELQLWRQNLDVAYTISAAVEELRERLETNDPDILGALGRIDGGAQILIRTTDTEAPEDV